MKAKLVSSGERLRASYWFIPTLMAVGAFALSYVMGLIDATLGMDWVEQFGWIFESRPEGARAVLSAIATSMITVAGVVFSITIAAVAYATSQFGPRLLTNFMRDRGNQFTLGTFIATFLYCLLVLWQIRSPAGGGGGPEVEDAAIGFVPHLSVLVGLALSLASIGVLIYFIHHVPESIHASNVAAVLGKELRYQVEEVFPEHLGEERNVDVGPLENIQRESAMVEAPDSGYITVVDTDAIIAIAKRHDLVLHMPLGPGRFVTEGTTLLYAWPADRLDSKVRGELHDSFSIDRQRTPVQDELFLVDELVEISARALSPGINDPFTAMNCADWLTSAAILMSRRNPPSPYRFDEDGKLRVVAHEVTFERLAAHAFDGMRPYFAPDRNAGLHLMHCFSRIARFLERPSHREEILQQARKLHEAALEHLTLRDDVQKMDRALHDVEAMLAEPGPGLEISSLMRGG